MSRPYSWQTSLSLLVALYYYFTHVIARTTEPSDAHALAVIGPEQDHAGAASACKLAATNAYLSLGHGSSSLDCAPSLGTLRSYMIFIDFDDAPARQGSSTPEDLRRVFVPGAAEWYANASYGKLALSIEADVSRFHRMRGRSDSYGARGTLTYELHQTFVQDAIEAHARSGGVMPQGLDVLYVVPTMQATALTFSATFMGTVRRRAGGGTGGGGGQQQVARKAVTFGRDAFTSWRYKVLNHETGHTMCLPDLYPLPDGPPTGLYVGGWDLMGLISGPGPDYFAWNKWKLGWLSDSQIACIDGPGSSVHTLVPLHLGEQQPQQLQQAVYKAVVVRRSATEALVAEVRSSNGPIDAPCAAGVLLYTVSTTVESGKGPIRVVDATPGSAGCAGDGLNDATMRIDGPKAVNVSGWGVTVTLMEQSGDRWVIKVDKV